MSISLTNWIIPIRLADILSHLYYLSIVLAEEDYSVS